MPRKGDQVRVTVEGVYSHQGNTDLGKQGYHVITVPGDGVGTPDRDIALSPETSFQVTKRYVPPEPAEGLWVRTPSGVVYRRIGNLWFCNGNLDSGGHTWKELAEMHRELPKMADLGGVKTETVRTDADYVELLGVPVAVFDAMLLAKQILATFGDV